MSSTGFPIEFTEEFRVWWDDLSADEQESVDTVVGLLEEKGWKLKYPYSSDVKSSKYGEVRELRVQHLGQPYRVLYAFDPRQVAVLILGGVKTGKNDWYNKYVPLADRIYCEHLKSLKEEESA